VKSTRSLALVILVELLALCVCLALLGVVIGAVGISGALPFDVAAAPSPSPDSSLESTATRQPTGTRLPTLTPAPTYTRVLPLPPANTTFVPGPFRSATATVAPNFYNLVVPTPTAPILLYPITFASNLKVVTYAVTGQTQAALSRSLNDQALSDPNEVDGRYYARTDWFISAQWDYRPTARGCEVDIGSVTLAMTMTLPMLSSSTGVPPDLLNRWTTFISNTITHETGHVKLSEQGARAYQHDLGNFTPAADCMTIKPELSDLFTHASSAIRKSNVDYDAQTNHGETQGAVFPGN
jgi:predicted secreted Zn-dependent protease